MLIIKFVTRFSPYIIFDNISKTKITIIYRKMEIFCSLIVVDILSINGIIRTIIVIIIPRNGIILGWMENANILYSNNKNHAIILPVEYLVICIVLLYLPQFKVSKNFSIFCAWTAGFFCSTNSLAFCPCPFIISLSLARIWLIAFAMLWGLSSSVSCKYSEYSFGTPSSLVVTNGVPE